ncbi:rna polymerase iii c11 subunit [Piedraia hortae CBS 480.64]|uniref:DNA-directed RNA polymerase subunit n=1 Tax=Piedraia hortae CBS 480.64 TaxID=1314780 RepID=A0A6A7BR77_9PEZI|nr:rna polymerase iii c11 subunit [Piedraia hortae CBS 480.64]
MLLFCPNCSNTLSVTTNHAAGGNCFTCRTCPYQKPLDDGIYYERHYMPKKKRLDGDILGGADAWKNVDRTPIRCKNDRCGSNEAYFRQVQIRSADEPMTTFYKCCRCGTDWREN